jgi:murein tripeptide amidase MpaA
MLRKLGLLTAMLWGLFVMVTALADQAAAGLPPSVENPSQPTGIPGQAGSGPSLSDYWVVRAYYDDPAMVGQLAAWTEPWEVNREEQYITLGVSTADLNLLILQGFDVIVDEQLTADLNQPRQMLAGQTSGIPGYPCYRTVEETFASAEQMLQEYPGLVDWVDIGDSWEKTQDPAAGYDLMVLVLTNQAVTSEKPRLFVMSALHAREYATAELNTRFAEMLLAGYGTDPDITWLLDHHELHLLLVSNPDGRKHAEAGILWRKNTNENYCSPTSNYRGADLNRNFSYEWGCCGGSSSSECSEVYRGPSPASEPETQAIENYVRAIFPDQRGSSPSDPAPADANGLFIDIHSFSELVLWPWGYTVLVPPNWTALQTLGRKLSYPTGYNPEQAVHLYPTDGTTDDFVYGELGVAAYTFEIGTAFFQDCTAFNTTILPDNLDALMYAAQVARTPYLTPAGPDALDAAVTPAMVQQGQPVTVTVTLDDTRFSSENGLEPVQAIAEAALTIDVGYWDPDVEPLSMSAVDGSFNESTETAYAVVPTFELTPGRHTLLIRGRDAAGNWGVVDSVFLEITAGEVYRSYLPITARQPE